MDKYLALMCLLRLPYLLFLAKKTTFELSHNIVNDLDIEPNILRIEIKFLNHTPCDAVSKHETNSIFTVEVVMKVCFTLLHDITSLGKMKIYPHVDFCEST